MNVYLIFDWSVKNSQMSYQSATNSLDPKACGVATNHHSPGHVWQRFPELSVKPYHVKSSHFTCKLVSRIKVVEQSGRTTRNTVVKNYPWAVSCCEDPLCFPCSSGGTVESKVSCRTGKLFKKKGRSHQPSVYLFILKMKKSSKTTIFTFMWHERNSYVIFQMS